MTIAINRVSYKDKNAHLGVDVHDMANAPHGLVHVRRADFATDVGVGSELVDAAIPIIIDLLCIEMIELHEDMLGIRVLDER